MYTCRNIPDIASDYISREGSARTRLMVALHLAQCRNCRTYVRGLKITRRLTEQSYRSAVPADLLQTLEKIKPVPGGSSKEP